MPEDRRRMGLVLPFEVREPVILGYHDDPGYRRAMLFDWVSVSRDTEEKMKSFDVRPADPRRITATLSGGNRQKLVLAREIERDPLVLVVGQPTRGVDIGAIEFIYRRLLALRDAGKAILLVLVELEEVMGLSDRILVMFGGAIVGELPAERATEQELGLTTIMFNFIAAALMVYLLANVMSEPGSMQPETRAFAPPARLPFVHDILASVGIEVAASPLNLIALAALIFGKWRPVPAMFACLLFGFLEAVAIRLQGADVPGVGAVPVQLVQALPYILTVVLLAGFIGRAIPPRALGVPYVKER